MSIRSRNALIGTLAWIALASSARGDYLDPAAFGSLGSLNLTAGDYTIDTDGAPVLRDSANNVLFTGTTYFQGGSFRDTVSVLAFDAINIGAGVNIRVSGNHPLALLSRSNVVLAGKLDGSGFNGADSSRLGGDGSGGAGGPGGGRGGSANRGAGEGPGGGPGGTGGIGVVQAGGGGYGGKGGDNALGEFGGTYGNLHQFLQGGSGGGATGASLFDAVGGGGGGGGGAIELGALGTLTFAGGELLANGGLSGGAFAANAGAGSGGGLLIHAPVIDVEFGSNITANGGAFFGGGGRVLILTDTATVHNTGGNIDAGAGGGANNQQPGVVEYGFLRAVSVPEPGSITLVMIGGCGVAFSLARARRRAS